MSAIGRVGDEGRSLTTRAEALGLDRRGRSGDGCGDDDGRGGGSGDDGEELHR